MNCHTSMEKADYENSSSRKKFCRTADDCKDEPCGGADKPCGDNGNCLKVHI